MKKALITGIVGQDGNYLSELLIKKSYETHKIIKKDSLEKNERLKNISTFKKKINQKNLKNLEQIIEEIIIFETNKTKNTKI